MGSQLRKLRTKGLAGVSPCNVHENQRWAKRRSRNQAQAKAQARNEPAERLNALAAEHKWLLNTLAPPPSSVQALIRSAQERETEIARERMVAAAGGVLVGSVAVAPEEADAERRRPRGGSTAPTRRSGLLSALLVAALRVGDDGVPPKGSR